MPHIEFIPQVKVTDLLTSVSVFCAAVALIYTWMKDRGLRSKEYADKIRSAASITLSKVDRCQNLFQSITDVVQPAITEVDGLMVESKDVVKCRDLFWKRLHELRTSIMDTFREEQIEVAYAPLFVYSSSIYHLFEDAMKFAKAAEAASFAVLQEKCQAAILSLHPSDASSAILGNVLRGICAEHELQSSEDFSIALSDVRSFLKRVLSQNDKELMRGRENFLGERQSQPLDQLRHWLNSWVQRPSEPLSSFLKQHNRVTEEELSRRACEAAFTKCDPGAVRLWRGWGGFPRTLRR
jgi:hypothetical protein